MNRPIRTYREFRIAYGTPAMRIRERLRDAAVSALSLTRRMPKEGGWIRFPFYHHVFDDERAGFARHLKFYRAQGEFIAWDDAVALLAAGKPIDGRFFCLSFDDGFKSCVTNALPLLAEHDATAAFFVPTRYVGLDAERDREEILRFYERPVPMEFMDWADCRTLAGAGMTVGSHSDGHVRLAGLDPADAAGELSRSKARIERELGRPCLHFGCPFGGPGTDFLTDRDPGLAKAAGYASFATTLRGGMRAGDSPYFIRRDHAIAAWPESHLRYFLGS